jgi:transcriptional regulator with GAF, ATPase, and Fis domain
VRARWASLLRAPLTAFLLAGAAAALYLALFGATQRLLGPVVAFAWALASAGALAIAIPAVEPVRRRVEGWIEQTLFAERERARRGVHEAIRQIARFRGEEELAHFVREALAASLGAGEVRLVAGPADGELRELGPEGELVWALAPGDPLGDSLRAGLAVESARAADPARPAESRLLALGLCLAVGVPPRGTLRGGILLGPRRGAGSYDGEDRALVEALAAQTTLALANARAFEEIRALERRLREENRVLRQELFGGREGDDLVGESAAFRSVLAQVRRVAPTDATVLLLGETGSGKEGIAAAIHRASRRAERPFVAVACAALPESLLESELFGSERGAFTGAEARRLGRLEIADGGTLFLDDVDTLPLGVQSKLLRALQEGEVQRLGSPGARRVDVRLLAASNRDLRAQVRAGRFREDLYYRLHVVPIRVPPLRERREDIPLLVDHFVRRESRRLKRSIESIPPETLDALRAYPWPGNVRELRNVVERALVMSGDGVLRLPGPLVAVVPATAETLFEERARADLGRASLAELVRRYKARLIREALARSGGSQRRAADLLGIHRPSLARMLRALPTGLPPVGGGSDGARGA